MHAAREQNRSDGIFQEKGCKSQALRAAKSGDMFASIETFTQNPQERKEKKKKTQEARF